MKKYSFSILTIVLLISFVACTSNSSESKQSFCDTVCFSDSVKFNGTNKAHPEVFITAGDCKADSIIWSYEGMGSYRKADLATLLGTTVHLNKDFIRCYFNEAKMAWLFFNDCANSRGFLLQLPFKEGENFSLKPSAINNLDPKFSISDNLAVTADRGNLFIEDMNSGKKTTVTFGEAIDIDYNALHAHLDSVNITDNHAWIKVLVSNKWKIIDKDITLE
ncbi:MAG: hypothetical protein R2796_06120 [Chitinophagaceae bacterium]